MDLSDLTEAEQRMALVVLAAIEADLDAHLAEHPEWSEKERLGFATGLGFVAAMLAIRKG